MASGLEMMLQSFGVDTDEIKRNTEGAVALVKMMNDKLTEISQKLDRIEARQLAQEPEAWPPRVTMSYDELKAETERTLSNYAGRTEGDRDSGADSGR